MRDAKLRLALQGLLLVLAVWPSPCHGLCSLVNGTVARCHYLDDARYIDTYNLGTLKTSISGGRLQAEVFGNLSSLRHLELTHGELASIEPEAFRHLRELRSLDLSNNKIKTLEPAAFDGLRKLHSLSLRKNALTRIPTAVLSLKSLKVLDVSGNPLDCGCQSLKVRNHLLDQGVRLTKRILCSSPTTLKGKSFLELDVQVICMFEDQDKEMQMDQPDLEGSGGVPSGDPFDDQTPEDLDEEERDVTVAVVSTAAPEEVKTPAPSTKSAMDDDLIVPAEGFTAASSSSSFEVPSGDPFDDQTPEDLDEEERDVTVAVVSTAAPEEVETPAPSTKSAMDDDLIVPAEGFTAASSSSSSSSSPSSPSSSSSSSSSSSPSSPSSSSSSSLSPSSPSSTEAPTQKATITTTEDELFFSEENVSQSSTSPLPTSSAESTSEVMATEEPSKKSPLKQLAIPVEGSGEDDDLHEGSGIEGSGTGVPPISWDVPEDETASEISGTSTAKDDGWFSLLWDTLAGTSAPPEDDTTKDLNLQEEEFISASTERPSTTSSRPPEEVIVPVVAVKPEGAPDKSVVVVDPSDDGVGRALDESKSGQVKAEAEGTAESADASLSRQPQKGMGSYVVLAVLLGILGALIGFAAYKGEFCTKKRKRNDVEGGTELKDMTKSLLDAGNGAQPKIAPNGNLENVPLVSSQAPDDSKGHREPGSLADGAPMKYSVVPDVIDPVKPPRKSFVSQEDPDKAMTNGRSHQDLVNSSAPTPEVCLRVKSDAPVNGKNRHSASSLGTDSRGSPSVRTSPPLSIPNDGSLGCLQGHPRPPLSPGAQRVKITLQENPDSLPRTPILITRTKAGENLVKTP